MDFTNNLVSRIDNSVHLFFFMIFISLYHHSGLLFITEIPRYAYLFLDIFPILYAYSMVPNNSAARLLIFEIFSLPTRLIWTYTLIKIQIIFLPTCLLSIILNFVLSNFNAFYSLFSLQLLQ